MYYVIAIVMTAIGGALCYGVILFAKKVAASSVGSERANKQKMLDSKYKELLGLTKFADAYASKGQLQALLVQVDEAKQAVEDQKTTLKQVEESLDKAQKMVEEKETSQQELKTMKEEDERKLSELLENYESMAQEAVTLEQQLAQSMKDLDQMMSEITLTADQKSVFEQLSESLLQAGSRLRDLITEYEAVKERLESLKQQHKDLEEEYTRLVEQQLGL